MSAIILVINKSDCRTFCYHSYDYRPNWTPLSPITITYPSNIFRNTRSFQNWGILSNIFPFLADRFRPFWSQIGYEFCPVVLNWVCLLEDATFFSSSTRPTKALHNVNIGLKKGTNYKIGLEQGIDLRVRC